MAKKRKTPKLASRLFEELKKIQDSQAKTNQRVNALEETIREAAEKREPRRRRTLIDDALGLEDEE